MHSDRLSFIPLDQYVNDATKIRIKCNTCNYIWSVTPNNLFHGRGCPKCSGKIKRTREEIIREIQNRIEGISMTGEYVNYTIKTRFMCEKCGNIWDMTPKTFLSKKSCPSCQQQHIVVDFF